MSSIFWKLKSLKKTYVKNFRSVAKMVNINKNLTQLNDIKLKCFGQLDTLARYFKALNLNLDKFQAK